MKPLIAIALGLSLTACSPDRTLAQQQDKPWSQSSGTMEISRSQTRQPSRGPESWFTGATTITPLFDARDNSQVGAALVRFEPGGRTAWHEHPLGQRLVVIEGIGWTQVEGGSAETIRAGDVVWCPPGVRHWHGATPTTAMSHIAIQESQDGSPVTWMEHVTDAEYQRGPQ